MQHKIDAVIERVKNEPEYASTLKEQARKALFLGASSEEGREFYAHFLDDPSDLQKLTPGATGPTAWTTWLTTTTTTTSAPCTTTTTTATTTGG